jgi:hypothetical protein
MGEKSLLEEVLDDFTASLVKDPSVGPDIAQSLRKIINEGGYKDKEVITRLFKQTRREDENPES